MAEKPKVSSITVKVSGVDPIPLNLVKLVEVCIELEQNSPVIEDHYQFFIVVQNQEKESFVIPERPTPLSNGLKQNSNNYLFQPKHELIFNYTDYPNFQVLKFRSDPDDKSDNAWSNIFLAHPEQDFSYEFVPG